MGPHHSDVAKVLNNLAGLYTRLDRDTEAEALFLRSLEIIEKPVGCVHPDVAQVLNNLAMLSSHQGRYSEAEQLFRRSLEMAEQTLGPRHPRQSGAPLPEPGPPCRGRATLPALQADCGESRAGDRVASPGWTRGSRIREGSAMSRPGQPAPAPSRLVLDVTAEVW